MDKDRQIDEVVETDVLVVGGGLAGCWAAIRARDFPVSVVLADKAKGTALRTGLFAQREFPSSKPLKKVTWRIDS